MPMNGLMVEYIRVEYFFKFKNVQVVRRPNSGPQTRQNTQIATQGTAEEQFAEIAAAARAEALQDIDVTRH